MKYKTPPPTKTKKKKKIPTQTHEMPNIWKR